MTLFQTKNQQEQIWQLARQNEQDFGRSFGLARLQGDIAYLEHDFVSALRFYEESLQLNPEQGSFQNRVRDLRDYLAR